MSYLTISYEVLVITGSGEAFCAGWDLADAAEWPQPEWNEFRRDLHTLPGVCGYSRHRSRRPRSRAAPGRRR